MRSSHLTLTTAANEPALAGLRIFMGKEEKKKSDFVKTDT